MRPGRTTALPRPRPATLALLLGLAPAITAAQERAALPEDGRVVAGKAAIERHDRRLAVTQESQRAILEWRSFDIGADAAVHFIQPSSTSVALNRVIGGNPSRIAGQLSANGHVYLVNAAGVLFAPGARVDAGHLVTSAVDIDAREFMAGSDRFGSSSAASPGALAPAAPEAGPPPPQLMVAGPGDERPAPDPRSEGVPAALLTLDVGAGGHLRIGLEPAQVQALIDDGGLQEDDGDLVLSTAGSSALASSAVAMGEAPQARGAALRNGRLLLVAGPGTGDEPMPPPGEEQAAR